MARLNPRERKEIEVSILFHTKGSALPAMLILRRGWQETGEYELTCAKTALAEFNDAVQFLANSLADEVWEFDHKRRSGEGNKNDTPGSDVLGESSL